MFCDSLSFVPRNWTFDLENIVSTYRLFFWFQDHSYLTLTQSTDLYTIQLNVLNAALFILLLSYQPIKQTQIFFSCEGWNYVVIVLCTRLKKYAREILLICQECWRSAVVHWLRCVCFCFYIEYCFVK